MIAKIHLFHFKIKLLLTVLILSFATSCTHTVNKIPKEFSGKWTETSDDITLRRTPPQYLSITNNNIIISQINDDGEMIDNINAIELIEKSDDDRLVIKCIQDKSLENDITLILKDGFLYATEYLHSGLKGSDEQGMSNKIGKFYK
jgi:hypothetical protein